jgi:hypothetical protein
LEVDLKDLSLNAAGIVALAVLLGLGFRALYPEVDVGPELATLFVFVSAVLRLLLRWGQGAVRAYRTKGRSVPQDPGAQP